jgi:hypothetical protein
MGCTLDLNRVLSDSAMQTAVGGATSTFEGGRGEKISTSLLSVGTRMNRLILEWSRTKMRWWFERWGNVRTAAILLDWENELVFSPAALLWEIQMKSICSDKSTKNHFLGSSMKVRLNPSGKNWLWISEWIRRLIIEHFLETKIGALFFIRLGETAEGVSKSFRLGSRLSSLKHHKQFFAINQQESETFGGVER